MISLLQTLIFPFINGLKIKYNRRLEKQSETTNLYDNTNSII